MALVPSFWKPCQVLAHNMRVRTASTVDRFLPRVDQPQLRGKSRVLPPSHFRWRDYRLLIISLSYSHNDHNPNVVVLQPAKPAMSFPPSQLTAVTTRLTTLLKTHSLTVSIVETACGGLISSTLLSTPGASKFYKGGLTLYTLPSRIAFGGWTEDSLKDYKGPTPGVVLGLARYNKPLLGADWVLAESGTAGPTRSVATRNGDPGYVALAVVGPDGFEKAVESNLESLDRPGNMLQFAGLALETLADCVEEWLKKEGKL